MFVRFQTEKRKICVDPKLNWVSGHIARIHLRTSTTAKKDFRRYTIAQKDVQTSTATKDITTPAKKDLPTSTIPEKDPVQTSSTTVERNYSRKTSEAVPSLFQLKICL